MKTLLRVAGLSVLFLLLLVVVTLATVLQREPSVSVGIDPTHEDVARALALVRAHDPSRAVPGQRSAATISQRDLEVLLNHGARRWLQASTQVTLEPSGAVLRSSLHLPANLPAVLFGRWFNVQVHLAETNALPAIDGVQIGGLPLPAWVGERALQALLGRAGLLSEAALAAQVVQRVSFQPQQMVVVYSWGNGSAERMVGALVPPDEQKRLRAYTEHLAKLTEAAAPAWTLSLAPLLGPMFALAQSRTAAGGDAVAENRAAIVVLTLFANGRALDKVVPAARDWPRPRPLRLTLAGREDTPLHFLVSAALAVEGTSPLAKAIGIYKEVADSRGGSGFSFNDMAANRAGTRLGQRSVAEPAKLQAFLARGVQEGDVMPPAADLAENMPEAEFKQRFGGVGEPAYLAVMAEIEKRVDALRVLR